MLARSTKPSFKGLCRALLLAAGMFGLLSTGAAAMSWTAHPLPPVGNIIGQFNDVIFDGTQFWAVGANGWVQKSTDGATWTSVAPGPAYFFYDIAHGGGSQYVVVGAGSGGAGSTVYVTNDGGATWSQSTNGVPGFFSLYSVAKGPNPGEYVAVGGGGTIVRSTDGGVTWSPPATGPHNFSPPSYYDLNSVLYAPVGTGLYVAVGGNGTILTSSDGGNTWTPQNSGTTVVLENVAYANGLLVAVGWNGTILASPNGTTWTQVTPPPTTKNLAAVTYGACGWVATGVGGTVLSSPDGTAWSAETSNMTAALLGVAYGANRYVAVGQGTTLVGQCTQPGGGSSEGGKCAPLPTGAVAWWPLNETTGATTVSDIVGGHTGTLLSGPVASGGPNPTTGMVGGALYFTSQNTYVRVPDSPALNFGSGDFTIDAWVKPVQVGPSWFQPIVDKAQALATKGGVQGYRLYVKNGQVIFALADGSNTALVSAPVTYGTWHFVAAERAGTSLNLYINGALAATAPLPAGFGSVSNTADLLVGGIAAVGTPVQPVVGEIGLDEVELFNRALTAQEVQAIHQAGQAGKCQAEPTGKPDLAIAKKPTRPLTAGQQASYQIAVSNVGTAQADGPIVVTDTLGAGLTYVSATGSGWTCSASGQTVTCTHPGPVPPGGSLLPVTLTVQVAPDVEKVENCAAVKAVEQPASAVTPEVVLPDANPANNRACDVSPVGAGPEKPGMICGVKFLDHDGDGQQDPGEPGLPNWTIQVKDAAGNAVGTATTGKKGRFCLEVKPGTYTVSEVLQPGWVQTAPPPVPPGTATVTVAAGQTVFVPFGNRQEKQPCCLTFTLQGGKPDQFSTADGATAEPASPPPGKPASYFDQTAVNQAFWHRFSLPAGNCIREAKLEVFVKPLRAESGNDKIYLYSGSQVWNRYFGGFAGLLPLGWTVSNYPGGQLFTLDLAALPLLGGGTTSLLAALDANRVLDLAVQDDSSVDYARLTVRFCECAQGEAEGLAAAAKGGASEVRLAVGKPQLVADGVEREIDTAPVVRGGRTFLPVRALAEALGLDVAWDPAERKVTLTREDPPTAIELWVGKPEAKLTKADAARGIEKKDIRRVAIDPANPDVAPFIENGRVMLPVRFIAEALDLDVGFDPQTQQVTIKQKSSNVRTQPDKKIEISSAEPQGYLVCVRYGPNGQCTVQRTCIRWQGGACEVFVYVGPSGYATCENSSLVDQEDCIDLVS